MYILRHGERVRGQQLLWEGTAFGEAGKAESISMYTSGDLRDDKV